MYKNRNIDVTIFDTQYPLFKIFIQCGQHGDEGESREAGKRLINEIINNPSSYENVSIAICTNANPDGASADDREQSNGIDMNRDHLLLRAKETQILQKFILDFQPNIFVDVHNFPAQEDFLTKINRQFSEDVAFDKCNNPVCRRMLTDSQFTDLLNFISQENTGFTYGWYIRSGIAGVRHSTENLLDARNGTAFRFDCLGFIMEGREPRSDENKTTQIEKTTQAQFLFLKSLIKWAKNNTSLFMLPLPALSVGSKIGIRFHYNIQQVSHVSYTILLQRK